MDNKYNINDQLLFLPKKNNLTLSNQQDESIILGANEARLLEYLIENRHRTIPRKELITTLWNTRDIYVDNSSLTQAVSTLRKSMNDSTKHPIYIKTVPKLGYEFIAPVTNLNQSIHNQTKESEPRATTESQLNQTGEIQGNISPHLIQFQTQLVRFELFILLFIGALIVEFFFFQA
ncbi:winged helix-turn-helix domain-containing protein [Vibrio sp. THAF190c]|uniref:winged helix-turn-helix domain-containing protein n=1 Tax=Vibrio sp. THAF190c TaxID=2587865 RepID=UPI00126839AC|nr:winged helix-turn-helix domain-containing protein [Vibrio sp. THAF190c]QFT09443.1 Transcriptional activator CadC [Vibrio sp. THAF190c]